MIKNSFSKALALFTTVLSLSLISCADNFETSDKTGASSDKSYNDEGCAIQLFIDDSAQARSALPDITKDDLKSLYLSSYNPETKITCEYGPWLDVADMENDKIIVKKGTQIFTLYGYAGSSIYDSTVKVNVSSKEKSISFPMVYAGNSSSVYGKGNFSIHVTFPLKDGTGTESLKLVTAELLSLSGKPVPGFAEEAISFDSTGNATYSKNNVKNGNYFVCFKFYADLEKQVQIGFYQEFVNVSIGLTSSSDISIDSFKNIFPITYNLNENGTFAEGTTVPSFYSANSPLLDFPTPTPKSELFEFDGWYELDPLFGALIKKEEFINTSKLQPLNYVAKWNRNIEITLNGNGGQFSVTKDGITTKEDSISVVFILGQEKSLPPASSLNLSTPAGKTHFVGWSKSPSATQLDIKHDDYPDAGTASFTKDTTLYAIFSSTPAIDENSDMDNDGISDLEEINVLGTDPNSDDTDGDGWSDKLEKELFNKNLRTFDPCVADIPSLKVTMIGKPTISYNYSTSSGKTESESVSTSEGINHSESHSSSQGTTSSSTHGWNFQVKEGYSWADKGGFSMEFTEGCSGSYSNGSSYSYSQNEAESQSKTFSQGKSYTNNTTKTITGGTVKLNLKVTNNGEIAYTVNNFNVTLYRIASNGLSTRFPVNTVYYDKKFLLAPEKSVDLIVSFTLSNPGTVEDLLARSSGFYIAPSGYNITISDVKAMAPRDFTYDLTKVRAKTARINIDYGVENPGKKEETYQVSTKFKYNKDATTIENEYFPVTLREVLEKVGISEEEGTLTLTNGKITGIRNVNSKGSLSEGEWFILHVHKTINGETAKMYNAFTSESVPDYSLDDIIVSAQDSVQIFFDRDEDDDGVPLSEETINGCSDKKVDSDGDGLTDFEELYGFERDGVTYYTNPMNRDTDGDSDPEEGFNLGDNEDPNPIDPIRKNIARLASLKYGKTPQSLTEYTEDLKDQRKIKLWESGMLAEYGETLVLQAQAKFLGSRLFWGFEKDDGSIADTYTEFESEVEIPLPKNGTNTISLKVLAPDGTTTTYYSVILKSAYNPLKGFSAKSSRAQEASVSWNQYSDSRFEGYLLHVKKADSATASYSAVTIDKNTINDAKDSLSNKGSDFFVCIDKETALAGMKKITGIAAGDYYFFALYGYGSTTESTVSSKLLASKNIKMAIPEKGTLKLYAHYVEAIEDCDGGYDPDYYWTFSASQSFSSLDSFNVSRKSIHDFDDDDNIYYDFASKTNTGTTRPDLSYANVAHTQISRDNGTEVTISWSCTEADSASSDDFLGTKKIVLTYNKSSDSWSVKIDGNIFNGSDDSDRNNKTRNTSGSGTLNRDGSPHLCYLYTNSGDGKVKVWLSLEWCWD